MKPRLRLIHHLHRTGGTLISKCIASLPDVALLSEVHPGSPSEVLDPAFQAEFWLRLLNSRDGAALAKLPFVDKIRRIAELAQARGETLVIRDWAYLDYLGRPFVEQPSNRLASVEQLADHFELLRMVSIRHPLDQWLSWLHYRGAAQAADVGLDGFLHACERFQHDTVDLPRVRYEDFTAAPTDQMKSICAYLDLPYDDIWHSRWPHYHQITGDDSDRAGGSWKIAPRPRRPVPPGLARQLADSLAYQRLLDGYGYE